MSLDRQRLGSYVHDMIQREKQGLRADGIEGLLERGRQWQLGDTLRAGGSAYDIVVGGGSEVIILRSLGLIQKLDHSKLPNLKYLRPDMHKTPYDPGNVYSVPKSVGMLSFWYRPEPNHQS